MKKESISSSGYENKKYKIIVIEDDEGLNRIIQKNIIRAGYELDWALTGNEALSKIKGVKEEILLVDYKLPDMNAHQLIEKLVLKNKKIPTFIVMTGFGGVQQAVEMMRIGARDFLIKESDFLETLSERIIQVINDIEKDSKLAIAEKKLKKSELRYHDLFSKMIDAFAIHEVIRNNDGEVIDYITLDVNPTFEKLLGVEKKFVIGKKASEILPPEELKKWLEVFGPIATKGESARYEIYSEHNDKYFDGIAFTTEKNKFTVTFSDVTERRKAEEQIKSINQQLEASEQQLKASIQQLTAGEQQLRASELELRKSNSFLNTIIDKSPIAMWLADPDGTIIRTNRSLLKYLNLPKEAVVGKYNVLKDQNLVEQNLLKKVEGIFQKKKATRFIMQWFGNRSGELSLTTSNNPWIDVTMFPILNADKELMNVVCQWIDITGEKETEIALRESESRYRRAQEVGHIGSWEYELQNDLFWGSDEGKRIYNLNMDKNEFSAEEVMNCVVENDRDRVNQALIDLIQKDKSYDIVFTIIPQNTNDRKVIRSIAEILRDENNNPIKITGVLHDITLQKQIEEELIKAKDKAEEADKLKTAFLANMSHEIRTPMNGILGFTGLLNDPDLEGEDQKKYIEVIQKSGERLLSTVNDIIEISKIETGQVSLLISEVIVNVKLKNLHDFFSLEAKRKGIELRFENKLSENDSVIFTDKNKLTSIISNLVKNAIKFTEKGNVEIGCFKKSNQLEFYVRDTGIGIPESRKEAIFNRFEQADIADSKVFEGSGLGLSIAKSYVEMLGGEIWVESVENEGSTFCFTLPHKKFLKEQEKANVPKTEKKKSLNKDRKMKVLIVEDDEISRKHLIIILGKMSPEIISVNNGVDAVNSVKTNSDIDLVLMDIKIPQLSGLDATKKIREFNKDVVVIAQTAFALEGDMQKALDAGCNAYISKPVIEGELMSLIEKYIN